MKLRTLSFSLGLYLSQMQNGCILFSINCILAAQSFLVPLVVIFVSKEKDHRNHNKHGIMYFKSDNTKQNVPQHIK